MTTEAQEKAATAAQQVYIPLAVQRHNLIFAIFDGAAIGVMSAGAAFVSVLVVRLGASPLWVSLLSSIPAAIRLAMTIPSSQFAERQTRPQRVWAWARLSVHVVYLLVAIVLLLLKGEWAARVIVIVWSLVALPGGLSNIMFTLVLGHAVPPDRRAFLMSRRWVFMGIAKLIALPLVSQLIDRMTFPAGYQIVYVFTFVVALAAFASAWQIQVQERKPPPSTTSKGSPLRVRIRETWHELLQEKAFLIFVGGRAVLNLGMSSAAAVIPIYWVKDLNASDTWVGYFAATLSAAMLISYLPWVRIKRKLGTRWTLVSSVLSQAFYPALLALTRSPVAVLPVIAFNGLAMGGLNLAFFDSLLEKCPRDKEARFVAINITAVNLAGVIGPPIGAALLGLLGVRWAMAVGTVISLAGGAIFAFGGSQGPRAANRTAG